MEIDFRECLSWMPDNMPESTKAVVVVSSCGDIIKRLPYKKWNAKNQNYSLMSEHVYKVSSNRGKQVNDSEEKIKKYGLYQSVCIRDKWYSVHVLVATAFIENPHGFDCVDHINGVRHDNRFTNLEWVTNGENVKRAWATGQRDVKRMRKLPYEEMENVIKMKESGMSFEAIGRHYGMRGESIRHRVKQYENGLRR